MSMPHKWVSRGKIIYNGIEYDLLSYLLNDEIEHKFIEIYKKYKNDDHLALVATAAHMNRKSSWIVEENKLYLTELIIKHVKDENENLVTDAKVKRQSSRQIIRTTGKSVNIFSDIFPNQDRVFASFVTQELRIKLSGV